MKTKAPLIAAFYLALTAIGSAFTLETAGYDGFDLPSSPVSVDVPGYGLVYFEESTGSSLSVGMLTPSSTSATLNFDENESVKVTFAGAALTFFSFATVGVSPAETFLVAQDPSNSQSYLITFTGSGDGAGISSFTWNAVPEPTSALLGVVGGALFAFRRRR